MTTVKKELHPIGEGILRLVKVKRPEAEKVTLIFYDLDQKYEAVPRTFTKNGRIEKNFKALLGLSPSSDFESALGKKILAIIGPAKNPNYRNLEQALCLYSTTHLAQNSSEQLG